MRRRRLLVSIDPATSLRGINPDLRLDGASHRPDMDLHQPGTSLNRARPTLPAGKPEGHTLSPVEQQDRIEVERVWREVAEEAGSKAHRETMVGAQEVELAVDGDLTSSGRARWYFRVV